MAETEGRKLIQKCVNSTASARQEPKLDVLGVLVFETSSQGVFRFFCKFCRMEMTRFSRVEREVHLSEQHFCGVLLMLNNQRRDKSKRETIFSEFCYFCNSIPQQGESLVVHLGSKHKLIYDVIPIPCPPVTLDLATDEDTSVGNLDENTAEFEDSPEMNFHELGRPDTQTLLMPDTQITQNFDRMQYTRPDTHNSHLLGFNVLSTQDPNIMQNRGNPTEYQYNERDTTSQGLKIQQYGAQSSNVQGFNVTDSQGINMIQGWKELGSCGMNMKQYDTQNPDYQRFNEPGSHGMKMNQYSTQNPDYPRFNEPGPSGMNMNQYSTPNMNVQGWKESGSCRKNMKQYGTQNPDYPRFNEAGPRGMNMNQYSTPNMNVQGWKESGSCGMNMKQYDTQNPDYQRFNEPGPRGMKMNQYGTQNPDYPRFNEAGPHGMKMNQYGTQNPDYKWFNEPGSSGINMNEYSTPNMNVQGWNVSGSCGMNMNQHSTQILNVQGFNEPGSRSLNHQSTEYPNLQEYNVPSSKVLNMTQYNMPPLYAKPDDQTMHRFDQNRMTNTDKSMDTTERPVLKEDLVPGINKIVENDAGEFINESANSSHNSQDLDPTAVNNTIAEVDSYNMVSNLEITASKVDKDPQKIYTSNNLKAAQEPTDSKNSETDQRSAVSKKAVDANLSLSNQNIDFSELDAEVTVLNENTDPKFDAGLRIFHENIAATLKIPTFENKGEDEEFAAETNGKKENITLENFKVSTPQREEDVPEKKKCKASVLSSTSKNATPSDVVERTGLIGEVVLSPNTTDSTPRRTRTDQNIKHVKGRKKSVTFHDIVKEINMEGTKSCTVSLVQLYSDDAEHASSAYTRTKSGAGSSSSVPRSQGDNSSRIKRSKKRSYPFKKEEEVLIQHSTSVDEGNHASLPPAISSRKRSRTVLPLFNNSNGGKKEDTCVMRKTDDENLKQIDFKINPELNQEEEVTVIQQNEVEKEEVSIIEKEHKRKEEDAKIKQRKVRRKEDMKSNQKKARGKEDNEVEKEEVSTIEQKKVRGKEISKIKQKKSEVEKVGKKQKNLEGNIVKKMASPGLLFENCTYEGCNKSFVTNVGLSIHLRSHFKDELQERKLRRRFLL